MYKEVNSINRLKTWLDEKNQIIDTWFGLSKASKKKTLLDKHLPSLIQEFIITYETGVSLENSLKQAFETFNMDETFNVHKRISSNYIELFNRYAFERDDKEIWRFTRLISQLKKTGSQTAASALEKFHDELWINLSVNAKIKSEKVTVQLTFILILSLISVITVVITPILLIL
jgi:hypothetical protein